MHESGKGNTEVGGRHLGASPDTCRVAIGDAEDILLQTSWLGASVHNGPYQPGFREGSWHHSYEKYGAEFGRFLAHKASPQFLKGLRKELWGD